MTSVFIFRHRTDYGRDAAAVVKSSDNRREFDLRQVQRALKLREVLEDPQAVGLAFFGVELRGEDIVAPDH